MAFAGVRLLVILVSVYDKYGIVLTEKLESVHFRSWFMLRRLMMSMKP